MVLPSQNFAIKNAITAPVSTAKVIRKKAPAKPTIELFN